MNILIIGSKGFIGSHVKTELENNKYCIVYECDVVADYTTNNYFIIDISNSNYNEIFERVDFDICINCSGAASVPNSLINPSRDFMLNTTNVYLMLDAIRKFRPKCKFINLSSAAVYGNPKVLPIQEDTICKPISPYGYHKFIAEQVCQMFHHQFQLYTCTLRIFSAYGNGLQKQIFWDIYKKSIADKNIITLFGTGNETRDFIHIEDIVKIISIVIDKGSFNGSVYNVANGVAISIKYAATQLLSALDYSGRILYDGEQRSGDPLYWRSDISKLKSLDFTPSVNFDIGIKRLAEWLKEKK